MKNSIPHLYYDILIRLRYHIFDHGSSSGHHNKQRAKYQVETESRGSIGLLWTKRKTIDRRIRIFSDPKWSRATYQTAEETSQKSPQLATQIFVRVWQSNRWSAMAWRLLRVTTAPQGQGDHSCLFFSLACLGHSCCRTDTTKISGAARSYQHPPCDVDAPSY